MGKKSTPKAPAAPDPVAVSQAQAAANRDAAITQSNLNRIDQYTPDGSLTYSQIGTHADGTPRYQQTQTYSPQQQALYDQQNQIAQSLGGLAQNNIGRVAQAQAGGIDTASFNPLKSVSSGPMQQSPTGGQYQTQVPGAGPINSNIASGGNVQRSLDYGGQFNPGDFNETSRAAANSVYEQAASRLNPQFQQQESDMRARLANSGISENSDAFRREMDNFGRTRNDAYGQANFNAISAGLAAQQQGYGQSLNTRQQNSNEVTNQGAFANDAQGQIFGQNAQQAAFGNAAQDQQYQQNLSNAGFSNQATGQQFAQDQSVAGFNNQTQNQQFNQDLAGANLNNQVRQQQFDEASYLRNLPLNDIAALLGTGGGVQDPTFQQFAQAGVAAPDYQGAVYQNYNAANQQYQQAQQARAQGLGSIFGALGSIGAGVATGGLSFSDRRLKHNVHRIGTMASGLPTFVFSYLGSTARRIGVMAQDVLKVIPDAVIVTPSGYLAVDYGKVY